MDPSTSPTGSVANKLKFSKLAQAVEEEFLAAQTQSPKCSRYSSPGRPNPQFFEPFPDEDVFEMSPTSGEKILNEWDRCWGTPPDEIIPGFMWLAQERGCLFMDRLPFDCFTHCVFATNRPVSPYPSENYLCIQLADDPDTDLQARFEETIAFIESARKHPNAKVMVHCRMGQSRSTTLLVAWMMSHYRCSLKDALLWVKERRKIICPNTGFFVQLQKYEKQLFGTISPSMSISQGRKAGCCSVSKLNGM
jgi:hypothetical protein